jgi:hypothetical protein
MLTLECYIVKNNLIMPTEERMMPLDKLEPILAEINNIETFTKSEELNKLIKKVVPEF